MTEKERAVWETIQCFSFEESTQEYSFETRLAFENRWSHYFTKRAIEEYKKFIFLATISNQMVSPSETVDMVWHQHLIYTESYQKLSASIGKKIAHIPSTHNPKERDTFIKALEHTKTLYEQYFGKQEAMFWETTQEPSQHTWFWDQPLTARLVVLALLTVGMYYPVFTYLAPILKTIPSRGFIVASLGIQAILFLILYGIVDWFWTQYASNLFESDPLLKHFSIAEVLCLKTLSVKRYIHALVNEMIVQDKIIVDVRDISLENDPKIPVGSAVEASVVNVLEDKGIRKYASLLHHLQTKKSFKSTSNAVEDFKTSVRNTSRFLNVMTLQVLLLLPMAYLLLSRLQLGLSRGKPVLFLLLIIAVFGYGVYMLYKKTYHGLFTNNIPRFFEDAIERKTIQNDGTDLDWRYFTLERDFYAEEFILLYNDMTKTEKQQLWSYTSDSNCGSSCGSSCGGGCGGCGGCGGD